MARSHAQHLGQPANTSVAKPAQKKAVAVQATAPSGKGKPMNLYMHPEDIANLRTLAGYLGVNANMRVSDSQVVKAALLVAHGNAELVEAFRTVAARDRRYKSRD